VPQSETPKSFGTDDPSLANDPMLQLTRIFVYFLQQLYRDAPAGLGLKWRPEEETSDLIISAESPVLDAVEKKPHITCVLGGSKWAGLGLDQLQAQSIIAGAGMRTHTDLVSSTISYHCQARNGLHARRLAWYSSYFTNVYRRVIMKSGGLHHVGVDHQIGPESDPSAFTGPSADKQVISVVATVPFYWQPQWRIRDPSEVFRQVRFDLNVKSPTAIYSANRTAMLRGARVNGRPVVTSPLEPSLVQVVKDSKFVGEE
jgi:hypothetical protein